MGADFSDIISSIHISLCPQSRSESIIPFKTLANLVLSLPIFQQAKIEAAIANKQMSSVLNLPNFQFLSLNSARAHQIVQSRSELPTSKPEPSWHDFPYQSSNKPKIKAAAATSRGRRCSIFPIFNFFCQIQLEHIRLFNLAANRLLQNHSQVGTIFPTNLPTSQKSKLLQPVSYTHLTLPTNREV